MWLAAMWWWLVSLSHACRTRMRLREHRRSGGPLLTRRRLGPRPRQSPPAAWPLASARRLCRRTLRPPAAAGRAAGGGRGTGRVSGRSGSGTGGTGSTAASGGKAATAAHRAAGMATTKVAKLTAFSLEVVDSPGLGKPRWTLKTAHHVGCSDAAFRRSPEADAIEVLRGLPLRGHQHS